MQLASQNLVKTLWPSKYINIRWSDMMKGQYGLKKSEILKFPLFSHFSHFWLSQANRKAVEAHLRDLGPSRWYFCVVRRTLSSYKKKYYGSASEVFLRSEAALKIPVRKFLFFFKNFHCLWWPSMYLGGIWCHNFRFSPMAKNVKNAIFHILSFWPKKLQKKILQIFSL